MDQIWFAEKNVTLITTDLKGTDVARNHFLSGRS